MTNAARWLLAGALTIGAAAPAFADRAPTPREMARIADSLNRAGYVAWRDVELDDGRWAIEGAAAPDGVTFDLRLDPVTYRIIEVEQD